MCSKECNGLMERLGKVQRAAESKALFGGKSDLHGHFLFPDGVDFRAPLTD